MFCRVLHSHQLHFARKVSLNIVLSLLQTGTKVVQKRITCTYVLSYLQSGAWWVWTIPGYLGVCIKESAAFLEKSGRALEVKIMT